MLKCFWIFRLLYSCLVADYNRSLHPIYFSLQSKQLLKWCALLQQPITWPSITWYTGQQHRPIAATLWESTIYGWSTTHFKWPLWKQCTVSVTPSIVQKYRLYSYTKQVGKQRTWSIAYMITTLYAPQASERQVTIVIRQTAAQFHDIVDNA